MIKSILHFDVITIIIIIIYYIMLYFIDTHEIYITMNKLIYVHYAEKDCSHLLFTIIHLFYYCKFTQFVKNLLY